MDLTPRKGATEAELRQLAKPGCKHGCNEGVIGRTVDKGKIIWCQCVVNAYNRGQEPMSEEYTGKGKGSTKGPSPAERSIARLRMLIESEDAAAAALEREIADEHADDELRIEDLRLQAEMIEEQARKTAYQAVLMQDRAALLVLEGEQGVKDAQAALNEAKRAEAVELDGQATARQAEADAMREESHDTGPHHQLKQANTALAKATHRKRRKAREARGRANKLRGRLAKKEMRA